ncbi:CDP-glycerol glycerophosphotransferase family protein [Candidatus Woesearchaeota archaeon]|nr:CDP-glycerol glycerophosphotransferase family protein [Candidatus Woesearchaeota archaeon]
MLTMSTLAFVNTSEDLRLLGDLPPGTRIIYLDNSPAKERQEEPGIHLCRNDIVDDDSLYEAYSKAMKWLKEWSCKPLNQGKNFKEVFTYQGVSIWWFIDFWLFYHELHRMTIQDIALNLHIVDTIIKKESPSTVYLLDDGSAFSDIAAHYCITKEISIVKKKKARSFVRRSKPYIFEFLKYKKYAFRHAVSRLFMHRIPQKADILLVGLTAQLRAERKAQKEMSDQMLKPIIDLLEKNSISYAYTDRDFTRTLGIKTIGLTRGIPSEYFMSRKRFKEANEFQKKAFQEYLRLKAGIAKSFVYGGIPIWPLIERRFDFIFKHKVAETALWIGAFTDMINTLDPKSILIIDETGVSGRAAIAAGRMCNKNVVGLQHGAISPLAFEYVHLKGEVSNNLDISAPFCPVPNKTAVYGENTRAVLINEGNYPEKSITITGQPRYDIIKQLKDTLDRNKVCVELGLDPSKKIILILTQPSKDRLFLARSIFDAIPDHKDCQIALKLHPRDLGHQEYEELARKAGLDIKVYTQDIFLLLFVSDIVIQRDSTVGIEAMLFEKPLICAYLFSMDIARTSQYLQSGCRIARTSQELQHHIREALDGAHHQEYLHAQSAWVKKEAFNQDGQAGQRVVDLMLKRKARKTSTTCTI